MSARLKEQYQSSIIPELREKYGYANVMQVPKLEKIVVNMGVGEAIQEAKFLETAMNELATITGQRPSFRKARKSISNFKLREGQRIGCMVTLRGSRMYEFMDRLFNMALPRVRDFRGIPTRSFDKSGNFTLGLRDQTIFPELNIDKIDRTLGMNVTFVIRNSGSQEESFDLLQKFGLPFQRQN